MLGRAGSERAGGAEWSQNAAKAGSVDGWIQGLRSGGGEGGGVWPSLQRHRLGSRPNQRRTEERAARRRVARGREPSVATTRRRQEAGVILTECQLHPIDRLWSGPSRCRPSQWFPLVVASEGTVCSGGQSAPYQTDRSSQATRKRQDRRAGAWYRIFCHKPHRRREKQRFLQIAMGAPAAIIAISTARRIRSRWHPPRCCEVVLQIQIPVSKGQSPAH